MMECPACGHSLVESDTRFCPKCGKALTAGELAPAAVAQVPGRTVTMMGLGVMGVAILLTMLPWFSGIGLLWSLVMLAGGGLVAVRFHPLLPPVVAGLAAVHAFQLLRFGFVPLLWVAAAGLLCYDQYRRGTAEGGFVRHLDFRLAWSGYRRYVVIGAALCLVSLFFTWGKTSGYWSGGYSYGYHWGSGSYGYNYNPFQYYWAGFELTGRAQGWVTFAEIALVGLVLWAAFRGSGGVPQWFNRVAQGLAGFLTLWWTLHLQAHFGNFLFSLGLGLIGLAVVMISRGADSGPYDMEHLMARLRSRS